MPVAKTSERDRDGGTCITTSRFTHAAAEPGRGAGHHGWRQYLPVHVCGAGRWRGPWVRLGYFLGHERRFGQWRGVQAEVCAVAMAFFRLGMYGCAFAGGLVALGLILHGN